MPESDVTEIIPGLWLGNYKSAYSKKFLNKYKINNVMTVMHNFNPKYRYNNISYFNIPIKDSDIVSNVNCLFNSAVDYIHRLLSVNKNILVHCKRGHHRSASIVVAYLIKYKGYKYLNAIQKIKNVRPLAMRRDTNISRALYNYNLYIQNKRIKHKECLHGKNNRWTILL